MSVIPVLDATLPNGSMPGLSPMKGLPPRLQDKTSDCTYYGRVSGDAPGRITRTKKIGFEQHTLTGFHEMRHASEKVNRAFQCVLNFR
ncbi:MAG: hypothetical protein PHS17_07825 [Desulfobacterales bacterium]|nr:hypothetical protein [Desulfobacterales bacterium]